MDKKDLNKNKESLERFAAYCTEHPEMRFWQALRNWAGASKIIFESEEDKTQNDTFYWI